MLAALAAGTPWKTIAPGVEVAPAVELGADPAWSARVVLVDPQRNEFLVRYDPDRPTLAEWRGRFPRAVAIVNGSFYSLDGPSGAEVRPTCDVIASGKQVRGAGCKVRDALFFAAVPRQPEAAISRPVASPRLLAPQDFKAEQWTEALKSFPALVRGGVAGCGGTRYCAESSRTAAVATLKDGRVLLFASQWRAVRKDVARWLAEQVGAVDALNLDGGPEATLALRGEPLEDAIGGRGVGLPLVLVVVPR